VLVSTWHTLGVKRSGLFVLLSFDELTVDIGWVDWRHLRFLSSSTVSFLSTSCCNSDGNTAYSTGESFNRKVIEIYIARLFTSNRWKQYISCSSSLRLFFCCVWLRSFDKVSIPFWINKNALIQYQFVLCYGDELLQYRVRRVRTSSLLLLFKTAWNNSRVCSSIRIEERERRTRRRRLARYKYIGWTYQRRKIVSIEDALGSHELKGVSRLSPLYW